MQVLIWGLKCLLSMLVEVVDKPSTTAVAESLSTTSTRCSVTEITSLLQDSTNRMRNLHQMYGFVWMCYISPVNG